MYLNHCGQVAPGETAIVPIVFLSLEGFANKLEVGTKFKIFDGKFVGDGEFTEILFRTPEAEKT